MKDLCRRPAREVGAAGAAPSIVFCAARREGSQSLTTLRLSAEFGGHPDALTVVGDVARCCGNQPHSFAVFKALCGCNSELINPLMSPSCHLCALLLVHAVKPCKLFTKIKLRVAQSAALRCSLRFFLQTRVLHIWRPKLVLACGASPDWSSFAPLHSISECLASLVLLYM